MFYFRSGSSSTLRLMAKWPLAAQKYTLNPMPNAWTTQMGKLTHNDHPADWPAKCVKTSKKFMHELEK